MNDLIRRERESIARELHDRLGQALTALKMDVAWIKRRLTEGQATAQAVSQRLNDMTVLIDACVDEMRSIAHSLRVPAMRPAQLRELIESHVRAMAARGGLGVCCDIGHDLPLSSEHCRQIFRIVQEAVTNVLRHANARTLWIHLDNTPGGVELRIRDDGHGVRPPSPFGALGLAGMTERAHAINARLTVEPAAQGGTLVCLLLPLPTAGTGTSDTSTSIKRD